jgi:hypothetical protein
MKNLKELINESFSKEYGYRIKLARDCSPDDLSRLEGVLAKYNLVSATPWKRLPIQENPMEFQRLKGVNVTSEVCSTDVVLKYPVNQRILEVLVCVEMNMKHDHVLCYGVNDPRRIESEMAEKRLADDKDRSVEIPEAQLEEVDSTEDQEHYTAQNEDLDLAVFGEEYNSKFLAELQRIKAEKGADYFKNYPTKDELMGDDLRAMHDSITGLAHGGNAPEAKQADTISQSSRRN